MPDSSLKINKAASRRITAARLTELERPAPLPIRYRAYLAGFTPQTAPANPSRVAAAHSAITAVMERAGHLSWDNFRKHCSDVAALVAWAIDNDRAVSWQALMAHAVIHDFSRELRTGVNEEHRHHRMRRLKALATRINPGLSAPPRSAPISHRAVQNPYTREEMHRICRIVATQPSPVMRRQLSAIVGACRGAGASTTELRALTGTSFTDLGEDGILVRLGRDPARVVPLRWAWEPMMRDGLEGVRPGQLLLGKVPDRRNVAAGVVERADTLSARGPTISAGRLRSTWLADLLADVVPIQVIMHAAGLRTARSVTDIVAWMGTPTVADATTRLRGERP